MATAITNPPSFLNPTSTKRRFYGLVSAMGGQSPAFSPSLPAPSLPNNYGFNDLANYEEKRRNDFSGTVQADLAKRRSDLSKSLTDQGTQLFQQANPGILEDLNSRGLFTSPTAVANAQANALKEIDLSNQKTLNDFDTSSTAAVLQSKQDALDSALSLRRGDLENRLQETQADKEQSLAKDLAKQNSRNQLTGSLIGAGSSLLGAGLTPGGFLSGLFKGGAGAGGSSVASGYAPNTAGGIPGPFASGAASAGTTAGTGAVGAGGVAASLAPAALAVGGVAGYQALSDKGKSMVAPLVNPVKTIQTVVPSVKKALGLSGSGKSSISYSGRDYTKYSPEEIARNLGSAGWGVDYDSNQKGSFENNYNQFLTSLGGDALAARYANADPKQFATGLDKKYADLYKQASSQMGRPLTGEEMDYLISNAA